VEEGAFQTPLITLMSISSEGSENAKEDRVDRAKQFVMKEFDLYFDELSESSKVRVKRIMSPDLTWSPTKPKAGVETTYRDQFCIFCGRDGKVAGLVSCFLQRSRF
jgi:hypothetical protein